MSAKLTTREVGDVTIVDVEGRITLGQGSTSLRDKVKELVALGKIKIILNLLDTAYVDSSGVGELVAGFSKLSNYGGTLKLLHLGQRIQDLLDITKLSHVFEIFTDEEEAVKSFR